MERPHREIVTLDDILISSERSLRPTHPPNWEAQARAVRSLRARQQANQSETMLQNLVEMAGCTVMVARTITRSSLFQIGN